MAALLKLYGKGQKRIMTSIFNPSCFKVNANAVNLLSSPTKRFTYPENMVRDVRKEHREPATVAAATMNQPLGNP